MSSERSRGLRGSRGTPGMQWDRADAASGPGEKLLSSTACERGCECRGGGLGTTWPGRWAGLVLLSCYGVLKVGRRNKIMESSLARDQQRRRAEVERCCTEFSR